MSRRFLTILDVVKGKRKFKCCWLRSEVTHLTKEIEICHWSSECYRHWQRRWGQQLLGRYSTSCAAHTFWIKYCREECCLSHQTYWLIEASWFHVIYFHGEEPANNRGPVNHSSQENLSSKMCRSTNLKWTEDNCSCWRKKSSSNENIKFINMHTHVKCTKEKKS